MENDAKCPVCDSPCKAYPVTTDPSLRSIKCQRCGEFAINTQAEDYLERSRPEWWPRISGWLRDRSGQGAWPKLLGNLDELVLELPNPTTSERLDRLLLHIESQLHHVGQSTVINFNDAAAVCYVNSSSEALKLSEYLTELGRIKPRSSGREERSFEMTVPGLLHVDDIRFRRGEGNQVFVAMWFPGKNTEDHALMEGAYKQGIRRAIRDAGLDPYRVDEPTGDPAPIDARVRLQIRRSRSLHADLTGVRPNVLYEAGLAEGQGIDVTWSVHKRDVDNLPFDTRQLPHIVWEDTDELYVRLKDLIALRSGHGSGSAS